MITIPVSAAPELGQLDAQPTAHKGDLPCRYFAVMDPSIFMLQAVVAIGALATLLKTRHERLYQPYENQEGLSGGLSREADDGRRTHDLRLGKATT